LMKMGQQVQKLKWTQLLKNAVQSWVHTLNDTWHLGRQMSHLSVETKLDSFFKPALLR
jgi:hypothetical protein